MIQKADLILVSTCLYTGADPVDAPFPGFVAIAGDRIAAVGILEEMGPWLADHTAVLDLGEQLVCPGFVDNHVFFTGQVWSQLGIDLASARTVSEACELFVRQASLTPAGKPVFGHNLPGFVLENAGKDLELLEQFGSRPVLGFTADRDGCLLNQAAIRRYGFNGNAVFAENCYKVFQDFLADREFIKAEYGRFSHFLAARGVTAIKEIGFDDYSGFTDVLHELASQGQLMHRVNLVSQPVGRPADFEYAGACRERFSSPLIQFMGFNLMVDGEIAKWNAHLLEPYANRPESFGEQIIDYDALEKTVLEADRQGYRCALHAEGDQAVRKTIDIFQKCREANGPKDSRHMIVDLEMVQPDDLKRMAKLGITAVNYMQIMDCIGTSEDFYGYEFVGMDRIKNYWPYRNMLAAGVNVCCGTDLPLTAPDIPLSAYLALSRRFRDGKPENGVNPSQALTVAECLRAWTIGGQYANFQEKSLGTIEAGKLADLAVLDRNIFSMPVDKLPEAKVSLTIFNGKIIWQDTCQNSVIERTSNENCSNWR